MSPEVLDFHRDGAVLHRAVLASETVATLCRMFESQLSGRPGRRLSEGDWASVVSEGPLAQIAVGHIGAGAHPVRAVIFDKTPETNWSVAWHQDRTIVVRERIAVEGFGPWSVKDGLIHVEPPISVLEGMVTLRLHLDDCGADNAPLKIALGSHRLGRVPAAEVADRAEHLPVLECLASAGDVWAYSTPILHASERSQRMGRRRVLQVDYAAGELPGGLNWYGIAK